jgi:ATP-dependent Clp protease adaptor protein ClpS
MPTETTTIQPSQLPVEIEEDLTIPGPNDWEKVTRVHDVQHPYIVILYNCDCHTFDEVILQMQKATGCSLEKAKQVADEVHSSGRAIAYSGSLEDCERVARILREIKLQVETDRAV